MSTDDVDPSPHPQAQTFKELIDGVALCIYDAAMLYFSPKVLAKLMRSDHNVTQQEVIQCFANRERTYLTDTRPEHQTPIPTQWFVSQTDYGRRLKIVFIYDKDADIVDIKSAYPATDQVTQIYLTHSTEL